MFGTKITREINKTIEILKENPDIQEIEWKDENGVHIKIVRRADKP